MCNTECAHLGRQHSSLFKSAGYPSRKLGQIFVCVCVCVCVCVSVCVCVCLCVCLVFVILFVFGYDVFIYFKAVEVVHPFYCSYERKMF